jgi:hypothetical protein
MFIPIMDRAGSAVRNRGLGHLWRLMARPSIRFIEAFSMKPATDEVRRHSMSSQGRVLPAA